MQDDKTQLPEGTDRIIAGASAPTVSNTGAMGVRADPEADVSDDDDVLLVGDVGDVGEPATEARRGGPLASAASPINSAAAVEKLSASATRRVGSSPRGSSGPRKLSAMSAGWSETPPTASMSGLGPITATMPAGRRRRSRTPPTASPARTPTS